MGEKSGCLLSWFSFVFSKETDADSSFPFESRQYLFTKAERSFYEVLKGSCGNRIVFAKVRLTDLVKVKNGTETRQSWTNKIDRKHVDFVLCEPRNLRIVAVLELDDSSHEKEDRQERDRVVDKILEAAQIPVIRIKASQFYDPKGLTEQIEGKSLKYT